MELYRQRVLPISYRLLELETDYAGYGRVVIFDEEDSRYDKVYPIERMWKARLRFFLLSLVTP